MGLFGKFGKKEDPVARTAPKEITPKKVRVMGEPGYWEQDSYFQAVPKGNIGECMDKAVDAIKSVEGVEVKDTCISQNGMLLVMITYEGEEYKIGVWPDEFRMMPSFRPKQYVFASEELEGLQNANVCIKMVMHFGKNPKKSFHLQVKLISAIVPDMYGLMDESAERIFSPGWVKMTANSKYLPDSIDLYVVQVISSGDANSSQVWLHTHGLNRCGLTELEILGSDKNMVYYHFNAVNGMARILLDNAEDKLNAWDEIFFGRLGDGDPLVGTFVPWTEALDFYPENILGGDADREGDHNSLTSVIFLYDNPDDAENHTLTKYTDYNDRYDDDLIFMVSDTETERMCMVARERFEYLKKGVTLGFSAVIKIGLPVTNGRPGEREHIWFDLNRFDGDRFEATLFQEPYNVEGIHKGYVAWFTVDDITDWLLRRGEESISPSSAYALDFVM